ncbi:MAG: HpcH/HpaI aldolase/citrate lyase family protein [Lachnospiraceae bacterium]
MERLSLCYGVGPLLYCPAINQSIADSLINEKFGRQYSLAMCLEDTIDDYHVNEAEQALIHSLNKIVAFSNQNAFYVPKIFIRVRNPLQISRLYQALAAARHLIVGFIIPKVTPENVSSYVDQIKQVNSISDHPVYMMPIIEHPAIINLQRRFDILYSLKQTLDQVSELILNIRVGGNDLCNAFGYRRQSTESIHDIKPVINILTDIVTVFGTDYIISGPVWEYYDGPDWDTGLTAELNHDRQTGFIGKTVIHPNQIPFVNEAYMVSEDDYKDALSIINWNKDAMVSGSISHSRMNEYKTHYRWAERILGLAGNYGIKRT